MCASRDCITLPDADAVGWRPSLLGSDGQHPGTSHLISLMPIYIPINFGSGLTPCAVCNRSAVML